MPPDYSPANNRLFFALLPPDHIRPAIAETARRLQQTHRFGGRLLKPERFHITLFFFGDHQPAETEPAILQAADEIEAPPFTLSLDKAGCFPNRDIASWLAPNEVSAEFDHLGRQFRKKLSYITQERNSGFTPHLTIGRQASGKLQPTAIAPIEWPVKDFVLIRSILHDYPARYEILGRWPLQGQPLPPQPEQGGFSF